MSVSTGSLLTTTSLRADHSEKNKKLFIDHR